MRTELVKRGVDPSKTAYLIKARPDTVDERVAGALADFGVVGVFLGVENASETGLKALIRGASLQDVEVAVSSLRARRIAVTYNLLIFHPDATLDEIGDNILFAKAHRDMPFDFGRAEVVAGSPLERMLKNGGRLLGEWPSWDYEVKDPDVERMCKINRLTFRAKGCNYSRLAESAIALTYQAGAISRLHPGAETDKACAQAAELIGAINGFIVGGMVEMYRLTAEGAGGDEIAALGEYVSSGSTRHAKAADRLSSRMLKVQMRDRIFESLGVGDAAQESWILRRL
jgi:hypothetical protein